MNFHKFTSWYFDLYELPQRLVKGKKVPFKLLGMLAMIPWWCLLGSLMWPTLLIGGGVIEMISIWKSLD